jgi:hypothetical protein
MAPPTTVTIGATSAPASYNQCNFPAKSISVPWGEFTRAILRHIAKTQCQIARVNEPFCGTVPLHLVVRISRYLYSYRHRFVWSLCRRLWLHRQHLTRPLYTIRPPLLQLPRSMSPVIKLFKDVIY